jgi:hypothetical protein
MKQRIKIDDIELLDYDFTRGPSRQPHKLKVVLTYFSGIPKIDIREYYFDFTSNEFKPTKRGVQLDPHKAEYLRTALEKNAEIIDKHLFEKDLEDWIKNVTKIESSSETLSNYEFYKTISKGGKDEVIYNHNHPLGRIIKSITKNENKNQDVKELLNLINVLLLTFSITISQFDRESKGEFGDLIDDINIKWNSLLKRILS